jgi:hypothetical protein
MMEASVSDIYPLTLLSPVSKTVTIRRLAVNYRPCGFQRAGRKGHPCSLLSMVQNFKIDKYELL